MDNDRNNDLQQKYQLLAAEFAKVRSFEESSLKTHHALSCHAFLFFRSAHNVAC